MVYVCMNFHSVHIIKFRPIRTVYAVKMTGTHTMFTFMCTQIKTFVVCIEV